MTRKEANDKFPKRNGYYYFNLNNGEEVKYPSVTMITGMINKPQLMYWASRETAKIALDDPTLSEEDVYSGFKELSKKATTRGKGVHNIYKKIIMDEEIGPYPLQYEPYVRGIHEFTKDFKPEHIHKNLIVKSHKYKYGGELDSIDLINGQNWLIDLKTGGTYPEHQLQLTAYYEACLEDLILVDKLAVLLLPGDGTYSLIEKEPCLEPFLALRKVWEWSKK